MRLGAGTPRPPDHRGYLTRQYYTISCSPIEGQARIAGRAKVTGRPGEAGRFRVAPLREPVWTAPYMHDGSLKTLEEVVDFYDRNGPEGKRTDLHGPLNLTDQEKKDLVD